MVTPRPRGALAPGGVLGLLLAVLVLPSLAADAGSGPEPAAGGVTVAASLGGPGPQDPPVAGGRDVPFLTWQSKDLDGAYVLVDDVDVTGDGVIDIATAVNHWGPGIPASTIRTFAGATGVELASVSRNYPLAWARVAQADGDSALEIVVVDRDAAGGTGQVAIYDGNTLGLQRSHPRTGYDPTMHPAIVDVDGDGNRETVTTESIGGGRAIAIYDITSGALEWRSAASPDLTGWRVENTDGDGRPEILECSYNSSTGGRLRVYDGQTKAVQATITVPGGFDPSSTLLVADIDSDGVIEIGIGEDDSGGATPRLGFWHGGTGALRWSVPDYVRELRAMDWDSDNAVEAGALLDSGQVRIYRGFTGTPEFTSNLPGGVTAWDAGLRLDGDMVNDLLLFTPNDGGGNGVLVLYNGSSRTESWRTTGTIEDVRPTPVPVRGPEGATTGHVRRTVAAGDFDLDGVRELLFRKARAAGSSEVDNLVRISAEDGTQVWQSGDFGYPVGEHTLATDLGDGGGWLLFAVERVYATGIGTARLFPTPDFVNLWGTGEIDPQGIRALETDGDGRDEVLIWGSDLDMDGTGGPGSSYLYHFKIDRSPEHVLTIPDIIMDEDTTATGALYLQPFFTDDYGVQGFQLTANSKSNQLNITINGTGWLSVYTNLPDSKDWYGTAQVRVGASDRLNPPTEGNTFSIIVRPVNDPPRVRAEDTQLATEGVRWNLTMAASDPEKDAVTWSTDDPSFPIDTSTGVFDLVPTNDMVGWHYVNVTATDTGGATGTYRLLIYVANANQPPMLLLPGTPQPATEYEEFVYNVTATDPDLRWGDVLYFSTTTRGVEIDPFTGRVTFTPQKRHIGLFKIAIEVRDVAGAYDEGELTLDVQDVNTAPRFVQVPASGTIDEGKLYAAEIAVADDDSGDTLSITDKTPLFDVTMNGPVNAYINFRPANEHVGVWDIKLVVTDAAGASAETNFTLVVRDANLAPRFGPVSNQTATQDDLYSVTLELTDPDGPVTDAFEPSVEPSWLHFDPVTGVLSGRPGNEHVGTTTVTVEVTDDGDPPASGRVRFPLEVRNRNDAPSIGAIIPRDGANVTAGAVEFAANAVDIDGDQLTYRWYEGSKVVGTGAAPRIVLTEGAHTIRLVVTDPAGLEAVQEFQLTARPAPVTLNTVTVGGSIILALLLIVIGEAVLILRLQQQLRGMRGAPTPAGPPKRERFSAPLETTFEEEGGDAGGPAAPVDELEYWPDEPADGAGGEPPADAGPVAATEEAPAYWPEEEATPAYAPETTAEPMYWPTEEADPGPPPATGPVYKDSGGAGLPSPMPRRSRARGRRPGPPPDGPSF